MLRGDWLVLGPGSCVSGELCLGLCHAGLDGDTVWSCNSSVLGVSGSYLSSCLHVFDFVLGFFITLVSFCYLRLLSWSNWPLTIKFESNLFVESLAGYWVFSGPRQVFSDALFIKDHGKNWSFGTQA